MLEKGYSVFSSIETDEHSGQRAIPYPHNIDMTSNIVQQYDCKSVADRLKEVEDQLTAEELGLISSTICQNSGGTLANTSFLEILRWWLLGGESTKSFLSYVIKYKLKCGQSGLARKIFDDACSLGRLAYAFNTAVQTVEQDDGFVRLSVTPSKQFRARKVVCTVPLNVLKDIKFQPALDPVKQEAIMQGHIDHMIKVHIEAKGSAWRTWSGTAWPGEGLAGAYGDGLTQAGNSHLVAFGPNAPFDVANNPRKLVEAVRHLNDEIEVERFVSSPVPRIIRPCVSYIFARSSTTGTKTRSQKELGVFSHQALRRSISRLFSKATAMCSSAVVTGQMAVGEASLTVLLSRVCASPTDSSQNFVRKTRPEQML